MVSKVSAYPGSGFSATYYSRDAFFFALKLQEVSRKFKTHSITGLIYMIDFFELQLESDKN